MSYALGVVLFAVAIGVSIALHEFGHLLTAKAFGMKAVRYFVGFGPTLWSFRRGETEYGVKAIPAGGYVKIVGMTHLDEVAPEDVHRAFWRFPVWKRLAVMSAGSATHLVVAVVVLYAAAVSVGLPFGRAVVGEVQSCVVADGHRDGSVRDCRQGDPVAPAAAAGVRPGDRIVAFDGHRVDTWSGFVRAIRARADSAVDLRYVRDGATHTTRVRVPAVHRAPLPGEHADPRTGLARVGAIGVAPAPTEHFGPLGSVAATVRYTGSLVSGTFGALARFPAKVPELVGALRGEHRGADTPVSVVGASRVGGQAAEAGSWLMFLLLLAGFNVFVGVFNMFPLLPLDGGHVAVLLFERARSRIAHALGRPDPGHVDLNRLAPITLVVIVVFGGVSLLTILADLVNPIQNPFR